MTMNIPGPSRIFLKTALVLGASYGGVRAAQILAAGLPDAVRVIMIDRNSHANHLYGFPRYAVLPGHEHKAFIPYTNIFRRSSTLSSIFLHARVLSLTRNAATLSRAFPEYGIPSSTLHFDYAIYALGARLPEPLDLWRSENVETGGNGLVHTRSGSKKEGIEWLKANQEKVKRSSSVLIVGGGALGIPVYPTKSVTILHSRTRLLPKFDESIHAEILTSLTSLDVRVILRERLKLAFSSPTGTVKGVNANGEQVMRTTAGREITADLVLLCTGQISNTGLLASMAPETIDPISQEAHVLRTLQLAPLPKPQEDLSETLEIFKLSKPTTRLNSVEKLPGGEMSSVTPYPHIFVIGDSADAFGAIKAGHTAYFQAEVAARNVIRLIKRNWGAEKGQPPWIVTAQDPVASHIATAADADTPLELYTPGAPAIKVTLGLTRSVSQMNGVTSTSDAGVEDLEAPRMWDMFAADTADMNL